MNVKTDLINNIDFDFVFGVVLMISKVQLSPDCFIRAITVSYRNLIKIKENPLSDKPYPDQKLPRLMSYVVTKNTRA